VLTVSTPRSSPQSRYSPASELAKTRTRPGRYDVVIVGASIAGCTAATMLARRGLHVALVERAPARSAFKKACTHYIQPSATPTIQRLGLHSTLLDAGAVANSIDTWTRYGWIRHPTEGTFPHGYNIRRERLDPMLREMACAEEGVELLAGLRVSGLIEEGPRIVGVLAGALDGSMHELRGRLVVGADGHASDLARLAHVPERRYLNRRFTYYAYFRDLPLTSASTSQLWLLDPRAAYAFPNDDGLTLVAYWDLRTGLDGVRRDPDTAIRRVFAGLQDGPDLSRATPASGWKGRLEMANIRRACAHRGMALIGDAAQTSDPLWGVGCGWALQSAEWLVDEVAASVPSDHDTLERALRRYRSRHTRELLLQHLMMRDYSTGRRFRLVEKLLFAAAARDPRLARHVHAYAARTLPVQRFVTPAVLARAGLVLLRDPRR
jgi:flavin-dependent dehydrogenase